MPMLSFFAVSLTPILYIEAVGNCCNRYASYLGNCEGRSVTYVEGSDAIAQQRFLDLVFHMVSNT